MWLELLNETFCRFRFHLGFGWVIALVCHLVTFSTLESLMSASDSSTADATCDAYLQQTARITDAIQCVRYALLI